MPLPSDWQHRATKLAWSTNGHGDESAQATLDVSITEAVDIIVNNQADPVVVYGPLGETLYTGRLDDPTLALGASGEGGALSFASLGGWAALSDLEESYSAVWSTESFDGWRPVQTSELPSRIPDRFSFDTTARLFIQPKKDTTHGNSPFTIGGLTWAMPHNGRTNANAISFDYKLHMPAVWQAGCNTYAFEFTGGAVAWSLNSTGAVQTGSVYLTASPNRRVEFWLYFPAANAAYTAADPAAPAEYGLSITNLRIIASTARAVSTTLTVAVVAGSNVTATVGSTAGMYLGQELIINSAATGSERVIVETIPSSTTFTADFVNAHAIGQAVQGAALYADQVADDVAAFVNGVNPTQLSATGATSAASLDLRSAVWEDATPADVLNDLCMEAATSAVWETGVDRGALYFRSRGSTARAWLIDVDELSLTLSLAELVNSAYGVYEGDAGETLRTAVSTDAGGVARYGGVTRRRSIQAGGAEQAIASRSTLLADKARLGARATLPGITALYDLQGSRVPLWEANAGRGDTITVRNVAPEIASALEARLTFRLSRTTYDARSDTLTVELEAPRPGL